MVIDNSFFAIHMTDCAELSWIFTICKKYWHIHPFILFSNHSFTSTITII